MPRLGPVSLTGPGDRSDRSAQGQHSSRSRTSSPIKKLINLFVGMCKSQRDIEVEQQRQWTASKKERDSIKMMHNAMNLQPPHSPISPSPPEVVIPSVEDRVQGHVDFGYFEQYGHIFYLDVRGSSHAPPPTPPVKACLELILVTSMEEQDLHMSHLTLLRLTSLLLAYQMLCLATTGMIIPLWVAMDSDGQPKFFSQPLLW